MNGALYYQDFDDFITRLGASNVRGLDGEIGRSAGTFNGDAEVWGAELDMTAILSENWYFGGLDTYQTIDVFLGMRAEQWSVELFARNLLDEEALRVGTSATPFVQQQPTGYANHWPVPSRRIGITASYRW